MKKSKLSFFEKKDQKTFAPSGMLQVQEQKFFAELFFKKATSFFGETP